MTLTGTFVLAFPGSDTLAALGRAARLGTAALGLLVRYLTRPPAPSGVVRAELATSYSTSVTAMRQGNRELEESGFLLQARRPIGKGRWQHLICVTDEPGHLPPTHEAWCLLDAALAAEQANTSDDGAHVATCEDAEESQVATCDPSSHIEPVNPFPSADPADDHKPSVVGTVTGLTRLAQLPPLPAPEDQGDLWLTPGQVLSLMRTYPAGHGDLALGMLSRLGLPFYLAPRVLALLMAGYDTQQLARTLHGVHEGEHPAALARWRLDQLILAPPPDPTAWRPPSTTLPSPPPRQDDADPYERGAARARAALRARGLRA